MNCDISLKNGLSILLCGLLVFVNPSVVFGQPSQTQDLMTGSLLTQKNGILVLHVQGTPYQMGYQQGVLLKEHIRVIYSEYLIHKLRVVTKTWWRYWLAYHLFKNKARVLERYIPDEYKQEMRGIADGSGLRYIDILMMNTWLDVISNPRIFSKEFKTCGNFVTLNEGAGSGLIHGRNLSWPSEGILEHHTVAIFYRPQKGNSLVGLTWPGAAGFLTGMNSQGVTIGEASVGTIDATLKGIPIFILLHKALQESHTIYEAISDITSSPRTTGYNITISDGKSNKACLLEFSANHYSVAFAQNGFVTSTNHYQDAAMFETMKPVYKGQNIKLEDSSSYKRLMKIRDFIQKDNGIVDPAGARDILSDDLVCTEGTFLSAIFQPKILKFSVAVGRANIVRKKFVDFDLGQELNVTPALEADYPDPFAFYAYQRSAVQALRVLEKETPAYKKFSIVFDSIVPTSFADGKVHLIYYEPQRVSHFPVVMILPHYAGSVGAIEGQLALSLVEEGIGAVIVNSSAQSSKAGHQWLAQETHKNDLKDTYQFFKQMVIESRRTIDWIETQPGVEREHLGILGLSFGAVVAPIVVALEPRIKSAVYLLGGGDVGEIIGRWQKLHGVSGPAGPLNQYSLVDPLTFAFKAKDIPTLMYNSYFDDIISRDCVLKLWRALQEPFIYWIPARHYSAILFFGNAQFAIAKHFDKTLKYRRAPGYMSPLDVFTHKDFLKKQDLQITGGGRYSTRVKRIRLGLLQEHVLGSPFFIGAEGTGHLEKDERYKLKGAGFDVYGGMMVSKNTKVTLKFENEDVTMYRINDAIAPAFFQQDAGYHRVNTADLLLERSTLNDPYYPTQGNNEKLEWDKSSTGLGSAYDFDRLWGQWRYYITPGQGKFFTYAFRTKMGWIDNYGNSDHVPYFERFFAGGVGSIRGYGNYGVGPRDSNDLPLGGDLLWVSNAEVRFPLYKKLMGAYFIDLGDVWDKARDIDTHTIKSSTGVALLYVTPWGVARLDWGARTSRDKDTPSSTVEATFGIPF